jgi:hypothetical protein
MDEQLSTCTTGLFMSPLSERLEYLSSVIAVVEFAPTWKNAYQVESTGIPDKGDHQSGALNGDTWPLRNFSPGGSQIDS